MAQKINIQIDVRQIRGSVTEGKVQIVFVEEGCFFGLLADKYANRYIQAYPHTKRSKTVDYNGNFASECKITCYKGIKKIGELLVYFNTQPPFKYSKQDAILFSCNKEIFAL